MKQCAFCYQGKKGGNVCYIRKKWPLFIFLVPGLLFLLIFLYIPFVENIKNSFYDMSSVVRMPGQEWEFIGFYFVILLTGLADIPEDIYEAASIDGCSKFMQVFYITLPSLKPVFFTSVTLAVTGALKVFDLPWVLSPNGAPQGLTHFLGTYMYQTAYGLNNYDYVSTQALLIVVLGVVVSKGVGWMQH